MSLNIEVNNVIAVLISGRWYDVLHVSFDLDSYEFHEEGLRLLGGGQCDGVPSTGFTFQSPEGRLCGPITSIQAVRIKFVASEGVRSAYAAKKTARAAENGG